MTMITVRCREGRRVPLPDGQQIPAHDAKNGMEVARDMFIERRLADGDIEIVPADESAPADPAALLDAPVAADAPAAAAVTKQSKGR